MIRSLFGFGLALTFLTTPVQAAWHEASSEHFVIYANESGSSVQEFAERLEKFHASMAFMLENEPESPSASNRITVFVVKNAIGVRKLADINGRYTSGIYLPRAGNIIALVPRRGLGSSKFDLSPETILRHEYAHHFLFNITSRSFPLWFQEGFAEFYASGTVKSDGTVHLGSQAVHRAYELKQSREVAIEQLLDTASYLANKRTGYDQFYGRSWLLYHYMSFEKSREGQMLKFQQLMGQGASDIDAAREAFGDLAQLDGDLDRYAERRKIMGLALPPDRLVTRPVKIRELRDSEAAMMPVIMESRTGVDKKEALEVVAKARKVATKYPDDPAVQEALAEAEYDAGNDSEAIEAADRALALDPKRVRAQIQKIYAFARRAESADDPEVAWKAVRAQIVVANRIEPNHPIPLMEFYRAYRAAGQTPPDIAIQGLQRALELAPFDQNLRMTVAAQYMEDQQYETAAAVLRPLAYNPHRSDATEAAEKLLKLAEEAARDPPAKRPAKTEAIID
ncbi:DUF1570 domain-containing protein [uncultured Parasphingorhabdus sp.]|uniref:DUF1570 domain-containing protein n=1 Tax=uncultured Parasphingorhabdus sp. TaxID=2709694 RepID=UPI0030D8095A|tara:strand:- start:23385 stop:24914 length:1530 start_codon:yes stop_codon:yes gene_type:complete